MRRLVAIGLTAVFVLVLLPSAAIVRAADPPPPPANDLFTNATAVTSFPFAETVALNLASYKAAGEDAEKTPPSGARCVGGSWSPTASVWYRFVPAVSGYLDVTATTSDGSGAPDPRIADYVVSTADSLAGLSVGICATAGSAGHFPIQFGRTYYLQISDSGTGVGSITVSMSFDATPPNDDIGQKLYSTSSIVQKDAVDMSLATAEDGEPFPCGGSRSIWYVFQPSTSGSLTIDTVGSTVEGAALTAFRVIGEGFAGLEALRCTTSGSISFNFVAGMTYQIQAADLGAGGSILQLNFTPGPPPGDTVPPVIYGVPSTIDATAAGPDGAYVWYALPWAWDAVSGGVPVACAPAPGSMFSVGETWVTCSAHDAADNYAYASFPVRVREAVPDTTPPVFTWVSPDVTVTTGDPAGAVVAYGTPTAVDDVSGPVPVSCEPPPFSLFPIGTTHVTCTASDQAGNIATIGFDLTVELLTIAVPPIIPITSYDVTDAAMSGSGCWHHAYTGSVTDLGRTFDSGCTGAPAGGHLADYTGGGGTLNDGLDAWTTDDDQLFFVGRPDSQGGVTDPVVTLHLDGTYTISRIRIYGGQIAWNALPGQLEGTTVTIGGESVSLDSIPFGSANAIGVQTGDLLDLSGTSLADIPTSTIVLSGFVTHWWEQFSIAEITVDGVKPAVLPPTIDGAASTYPLDARVAITAAPTATDDPVPSIACSIDGPSGVTSVPCAYAADAWALGPGSYTFTAVATTAAGKTASASATFDVVATYASVENLTRAWSSKPSVAKDLVMLLESASAAEQRGQFKAEANKLVEYRAGVKAQSGKAFAADKAALLMAFSRGL